MKIIPFCLPAMPAALLATSLAALLLAGCAKPQAITTTTLSAAPLRQPVSTINTAPPAPANAPQRKTHAVRYTVSNAAAYMSRDNFTVTYTDGGRQKNFVTNINWETTATAAEGDTVHVTYNPSPQDMAAGIKAIARIYVDDQLVQEQTGAVLDCKYTIPVAVTSAAPTNAQLQQEIDDLKKKQALTAQQPPPASLTQASSTQTSTTQTSSTQNQAGQAPMGQISSAQTQTPLQHNTDIQNQEPHEPRQ